MSSDSLDEQPGSTASDQLALLAKQEELREKRKKEEEVRQSEIAHLKKWANDRQERLVAALEASGTDFLRDPDADAKARRIMASIPNDFDRADIYYDQRTGIGHAVKPFQFVLGETEANVFAELFEHINEQVDNKTVLKLMGKETDFGGGRFDEVSELAKRLRKATGLTPTYLTAKEGTLTLLGKKLLPRTDMT